MTSETTLGKARTYSSAERYQYDTFTTGLILQDMAFKRTDPGPGHPVPAFDLPLVEGGRFRSTELGAKPVLMAFGSLTCPVTESSGPVLTELHRRFGHAVRFVIVNTREAHPGELIPQPKTFDQKERHAYRLKEHHHFAFEVAVDDIDGTLHRTLGPKPNSAYLLDPQGKILFRAHWANDAAGLEKALHETIAGKPLRRSKSAAMVWPLLKAIGYLPGVVENGGRKVARDVWRAVPPFGIMAGASRVFPFLPKDYRGAAAAAMLGSGLLAGIAVAAAFI